ncbi:MAG: helix-turn-helix transcriptional regulator [Chloroflexi bacterium]|nr:helix-turn-helix transcriptional regulator [Chloroflexota bacterium]
MEKKLLLLGLLRRQDMHGYQLNEFIDNNLALCTDLKKPTAYYLLDQMAQDGWISAAAAQEGNRPLRRVYRLTEAGEAAFQRLLRDNLEEYTPVNFSGDIGLAFLDWMPPEEALPLLEAQKAQAQSRLDEIRAIPAHAGSLGLIFSHQIHHIQAELNWLEYVLTVIEKENK